MPATNAPRLLDLIDRDADSNALGRELLRLAHLAAASHRLATAQHASVALAGVDTGGVTYTDDSGHGRPGTNPLARIGGSVATEGDR